VPAAQLGPVQRIRRGRVHRRGHPDRAPGAGLPGRPAGRRRWSPDHHRRPGRRWGDRGPAAIGLLRTRRAL